MGEAKRQEQARSEAHQHYDLAAAEAAMRDGLAQMVKTMASLETDADQAAFIAANRFFDEARLQFVLAGMRASNEGVERNNLLAAGARNIGMMMAGLQSMCIGNRERRLVQQVFETALQEGHVAQEGVRIKPMQAGHA